MASSSSVLVGRILSSHGLRGEAKVRLYAEHSLALRDYAPFVDDDGSCVPAITAIRGGSKGVAIVAFEGVGDADAAKALAGRRLYADRSRLPPLESDSFYRVDLVGLEARDASGRRLGEVSAVSNFGAGDILEIEGGPSGRFMLPFTRRDVSSADPSSGVLVIASLEGATFDSEESEG